jgi:Zn-dependent protease with chaperone function
MAGLTTRILAVTMAISLPASEASVAATSLSQLVSRPYLELLELAPTVSFKTQEFETLRKELAKQRGVESERIKKEEMELDGRLDALRRQLKSLNKEASSDTAKMAARRKTVHCEIQRLEKIRGEKRVEREHGVPVAFDNKLAKADLIEQWPAKKNEVDRFIAEGRARERHFGDIEDIGVRKISSDQEKDIKLGEEAVRDMKLYSLMPPELEQKEATAYVRSLAERIALSSDLTIPVNVTVLRSQEINAFAMPGGFLFINTGLLEKAENESELAGVIAHELAHVSARHGAQMLKRAKLANLFLQSAQIAAVIATGGVAGIGMYYALQGGFFGLGMVLSLTLLGVNRKFEAEADQLGAQYAWHAGYDPRGFITFFDKMASEKGYVKSASFFRTHPPFFERILSTVSEIEYLPKSEALKLDSTEFREFKQRLADAVKKESSADKKNKPTLKREPECNEEPQGTTRTSALVLASCGVCLTEE